MYSKINNNKQTVNSNEHWYTANLWKLVIKYFLNNGEENMGTNV